MPPLSMKRINLGTDAAASLLAALRAKLSSQGDVVSANGRELTQKVFGSPLTPIQVVERICTDVQKKGVAAVFHYTEQFDKVTINADTLRVTKSEMALAHAAASPAFLETVRRIRKNIFSFQSGLVQRDATLRAAGQYELKLRIGLCAGSACWSLEERPLIRRPCS